jgi:predicted  nucleic acid-binding Zn-ribbon protein
MSSSRQGKRDAKASVLEQIKEMKSRFETKSHRVENLDSVSVDLESNKEKMKSRKQELEQNLVKAIDRFQRLASNRQVYREVEEKDSALSVAIKECDGWSERSHRLRLNLETLRRALPRLLTKVTQVNHPLPALDQLPDAVHKLEDELGKVFSSQSCFTRVALSQT